MNWFTQLFNGGKGTEQTRNMFNEAFLWGGRFTEYNTENKTYIEEGYNLNPFVYSIINQQATKMSSIPFSIKKIENKKSLHDLRMLEGATGGNMTMHQKVRKSIMETKAYKEEGMPMPLERPNVSQTWSEFFSLYKTFLKTTGNVYIYLLSPEEGARAGQPLQMYILPSHLMQIVIKDGAGMLGVESPIEGYMLISGQTYIEFRDEDVIHVKYSNPNYGNNGEHLYGQSPLMAALRNIESSNKALQLNIKTMANGGAFGLIHGKGNIPMTKLQADGLKEKLVQMDNDAGNLAKIAGVSQEVGFTRLGLSAKELELFNYLSFDEKQIANVLGWSDKLLNNDASSTMNNIDNERKRVVTDNIIPDCKLLAQAFDSKILPRFKGYENTCLYFDFMELPEMQNDIKELVGWLKDALDRGVINRNEFRKAIGYQVSEDKNMEEFTSATDVLTLEEALNADFTINE